MGCAPCSCRRPARPATRRATSACFRCGRSHRRRGSPIVFHVGGGGRPLSPRYFDNGLPPVADFHGGAENFRSVDFMAIPFPPMQTLATMIFDGVLDRCPRLKVGVIEQGAVWLPSWMRQLDTAFEAFARGEERLRKLALRPERLRAPSDTASRPTRPSPSAGSSSSRSPRSASSRPTGRTSRAVAIR